MSKKLVIVWFAIIVLLFGMGSLVNDEGEEIVEYKPSIEIEK